MTQSLTRPLCHEYFNQKEVPTGDLSERCPENCEDAPCHSRARAHGEQQDDFSLDGHRLSSLYRAAEGGEIYLTAGYCEQGCKLLSGENTRTRRVHQARH